MTAPVVPEQVSDPGCVHRGPFRLAVVLVGLATLLILMGAMVTSTASGMAFRDWPLSDGELMPARALTEVPAFLEHFHRVVAGVTGLLALALTVWVFVRTVGGPRLRWSCAGGLAVIIVQMLLGARGVLKNLPVANSVAHAVLAQVTIATFAILAYLLSPRWRATVPGPHPWARAARVMTAIAVAALIAQTILGAIARHGDDDLALWTHVGNAFVVFLLVLIASGVATGKLGHVPGISGLGRLLLGLLVLQLLLGFVALIVRAGKHPENIEHLWRSSLISVHVLVGALLTVTTSLLAAHVRRGTLAIAAAGRA